MGSKNLHDKPFSESTIAKLEIFEDYASAWLPVFVMSSSSSYLCIIDFFAGTGYDVSGVAGSPIRLLKVINTQVANIFKKGRKIKLHLNEFDKNKFDKLIIAVSEFLDQYPALKRVVEIQYYQKDFEILFSDLQQEMKTYPSLIYLDQNGIKFANEKYLLELEKTDKTDFLYFISSSYVKRFADRPEFRKHFDIDIESVKNNPYKFIHITVLEHLKSKLPVGTKLKLHPYTIKKNQNIYGIVFGASHPLAVDKFLKIAWSKNKTNGQANFDIEDDLVKGQIDLFYGKRLTKIEKFKETFNELVLNGKIKNNFEALEYVHSLSHIGKHASDCLNQLKKEKKIWFDGSFPRVTYDNVYKEKIKVDYIVTKKNENK